MAEGDWEKKVDKLAVEMFNAYNGEGPNPWLTFDGRPVPRWEQLNDQVRAKWTAAARHAVTTLHGPAPDYVGGAIDE
jgi:hypothetical protein